MFGYATMLIQLKEKQPIGGEFMPRFQTTNFVFVGTKGQSLYLLLNILNNNTETYIDVQFNKYTFLIRSFYRDLGSKDYLSV